MFTPVKSASLLWALGGANVRAAVEAAHHDAVSSTISWVEKHAAYTRTGHGGAAQVDTTGLVCAVFDHRESRSSDPDLHTHVAVANTVCGLDGRWRSLDARGLHALGVAASERYNTRFEDALSSRLGVEFVERAFATRKARLVVGVGPAGAGKTTAMRAFAACWAVGAGRVVPLATSSKAAEVLGDELGTRAENLHKFLHEARWDVPQDDWFQLAAGDVVLLDEAGMAGTLLLAELVKHATARGAAIRLLGDASQLSSVEAGGALRLLESETGAVRLDQLHRFTDPIEAAATLALRNGDPAALDFYESRHRIRAGSRDAMAEAAYDGWASDVRAGRTSVLIAVTAADVAALNTRARIERIATGQVEADGVLLHDGNRAGVGDWVVTRSNLRGLTCHGGRDWVKNGDTWQVLQRHDDGSLTVRHLDHRGKLRLPAAYIDGQVELAYTASVHRSQGMTVDTAHPLVTPEMTREALYVAATRGRAHTHFYVATDDRQSGPPRSAREVLTGVLLRIGFEASATEVIRSTYREASELPSLVARYEHTRELAARAALELNVTQALPTGLAHRVLADPAASRLATSLADATGRGTDPVRVLQAAVDLDDLPARDRWLVCWRLGSRTADRLSVYLGRSQPIDRSRG